MTSPMMIIRNEQLGAFQPLLIRSFVAGLAAWAVQRFPALAEAPGALQERVDGAYRRARGYGLESRRDIARFVTLDLRLGPGFEDQPGYAWMRDLLNNRELSCPTRLHRIECRLERLTTISPTPPGDR